MHSFEYRVSLRVRHPFMKADEISSTLSLAPKFKWTAGEKRTTPKGRNLKGIYKASYWSCEFTPTKNIDLSDFLKKLVLKLQPQKRFFKKIRQTGGAIEFFVGWFSGSNSGETFDAGLLGELAKLQVDISLDVYGNTKFNHRRKNA